MGESTAPVSRQRLNILLAVNILFWGLAIFISPDPNVSDFAILAFLTTLALYPWEPRRLN